MERAGIFLLWTAAIVTGAFTPAVHAAPGLVYNYALSADECDDMTAWDLGAAMCMPLPMGGMQMLMVHGNAFAAGLASGGPRGRRDFAVPHMLMFDAGTTVVDRHYLNLDVMATLERWTFPAQGYPELLQAGEHDGTGAPYLDAQHPHSSPIMGLTLSDTIKVGDGDKDHLKVFFAPRGEATEGPVAFMHRATGMANPDAPLGHHVAQDVGHISSTVLGASLLLGAWRFEASGFNGTEPEPDHVDLPLGVPNSLALRVARDLAPGWMAMASAAYVSEPEHGDASIPFVARYSASLYGRWGLGAGWTIYGASIAGLIAKYDHAPLLASFGEELWLLDRGASRVFARFELLQRTPRQLAIATGADRDQGRWAASMTLGYGHALYQFKGGELLLGGSAGKVFLPDEFRPAYGGEPWSAKVFVQLNGMRMVHD